MELYNNKIGWYIIVDETQYNVLDIPYDKWGLPEKYVSYP
jgi:hypothetical protein